MSEAVMTSLEDAPTAEMSVGVLQDVLSKIGKIDTDPVTEIRAGARAHYVVIKEITERAAGHGVKIPSTKPTPPFFLGIPFLLDPDVPSDECEVWRKHAVYIREKHGLTPALYRRVFGPHTIGVITMEQKPYISFISIKASEEGGWELAMRGYDVGKASREAVDDDEKNMLDALDALVQPLVDQIQPLHPMARGFERRGKSKQWLPVKESKDAIQHQTDR